MFHKVSFYCIRLLASLKLFRSFLREFGRLLEGLSQVKRSYHDAQPARIFLQQWRRMVQQQDGLPDLPLFAGRSE
jgi:hypothetical protein